MRISNEDLIRIIQEELEAVLDEKKSGEAKKDACYHKVRSRYDVWPSAYASGALVKCRKVGAKNWGNSKKEALEKGGHSDELHGTMEEMHQQLADKHGVSLEEINKELKKGTAKEAKEHGEKKAHEVAMEHVFKDAKYYTKMEKAGIEEEKKKAGTESSKESNLRDWFKRRGEKGGSGGWVDCNSPDGKGGYKSCGRKEGEKRKKYPACRPTPGACKEKGKGSSWGKKAKNRGKKK
jgi:hypothetical protein